MRIVVEGFNYRTSGHYEPFGFFTESHDVLNESVGRKITLPIQDCHFEIRGIYEDSVDICVVFGEKSHQIRIQIDRPEEIRETRNMLGVQIKFTLERGQE